VIRRIFLILAVSALSFSVAGTVTSSVTHGQSAILTVTVTPSTVTVGGSATVAGTGFTPNNYVFAYWQRPDGTTNGTYAFTNYTGAFAFTLGFLASHGTGTEYVSAYDYGTGRWAPFFIVTVTGVTVPPPSSLQISASPNPVRVGGTTTVIGTGFTPNAYVFVQWTRPDGTMNGVNVFTGPNGNFAFYLSFLPVHGCGNETITGYDFARFLYSPSYVITVTC
jgi:hypothetical protein